MWGLKRCNMLIIGHFKGWGKQCFWVQLWYGCLSRFSSVDQGVYSVVFCSYLSVQ